MFVSWDSGNSKKNWTQYFYNEKSKINKNKRRFENKILRRLVKGFRTLSSRKSCSDESSGAELDTRD